MSDPSKPQQPQQSQQPLPTNDNNEILFPGPDDGRRSFLERPQTMDRRSVQESMAEAAARPLDFDPATRAKFIRDSVKQIQYMLADDKTEADIRAACSSFASSYPELFKKLLTGEDISQLNSMLHMLDQMATGNLTQHQASMIIGTRLAEKFLPQQFRPSNQHGHSR